MLRQLLEGTNPREVYLEDTFITYENYCNVLDAMSKDVLTEDYINELLGLGKIKKAGAQVVGKVTSGLSQLQNIAKDAADRIGTSVGEVLSSLKEKPVFNLLKEFKFNINKMWQAVKAFAEAAKDRGIRIALEEFFKLLSKKALKTMDDINEFMSNHPILQSMTRLAISGFFIWWRIQTIYHHFKPGALKFAFKQGNISGLLFHIVEYWTGLTVALDTAAFYMLDAVQESATALIQIIVEKVRKVKTNIKSKSKEGASSFKINSAKKKLDKIIDKLEKESLAYNIFLLSQDKSKDERDKLYKKYGKILNIPYVDWFKIFNDEEIDLLDNLIEKYLEAQGYATDPNLFQTDRLKKFIMEKTEFEAAYILGVDLS